MSTPPSPNRAPANDATRVLCSAVLARARFGDAVFRVLCVPRVQTMAPSPGIDLVVLARHAAWAFHQRHRRHKVLTVALAAVVVSFPLVFTVPGLWAAITIGVVGGSTVWALGDQVRVARAATRIVDVGVDPDLGLGLLGAELERRLAAVNDANMLLYAPRLDENPFPGAGQRVNARLMQTFDISKPKDGTKPAQAFTPSELLEHLAKRLPNYIAVNNVAESRRVRMVLYVRGSAADQVPGLLPDPLGPPVIKAPSTLLRQVADGPASELRTYLRAQVVGHGGHVVTTFHLTAVTSPGGLSLDFTLHVLRPINPAYYAADRLPREPTRLGWRLLVQGSVWRSMLDATFVGLGGAGILRAVGALFARRERSLVAAPVRALRGAALLSDTRAPAELTRAQRRAVGSHDFYGTDTGLREATSFYTEFDHNERNDANRHFNEIFTAVLRELVEFLESRNVDPYELLEERTNIIQNFTTEFHQTINGAYHEGIHANGNISIGGNVQANAQNFPNLQQATPTP